MKTRSKLSEAKNCLSSKNVNQLDFFIHQLDHIQRRQYLQEAKLQPKVKVVVYESEADNSGKNHYRNPVETQETVYCELSRSQRNEASFEAKAKRTDYKEQDKAQETKKVKLLASRQ